MRVRGEFQHFRSRRTSLGQSYSVAGGWRHGGCINYSTRHPLHTTPFSWLGSGSHNHIFKCNANGGEFSIDILGTPFPSLQKWCSIEKPQIRLLRLTITLDFIVANSLTVRDFCLRKTALKFAALHFRNPLVFILLDRLGNP